MGYWVGDGCFELITLVVMVLKAIFVLCSTLFLCSIGWDLPVGWVHGQMSGGGQIFSVGSCVDRSTSSAGGVIIF